MPRADSGILVLADDLSGAAEAAITLGPPVRVLLSAPACPPDPPGAAVAGRSGDDETQALLPGQELRSDLAVDLDCRYLSADAALGRTRTALETLRGTSARRVLIKIDSLLRGNVPAHLSAALAAEDGPVILAPTLPQQGRTVRDGVLLVDGVALAQTPAWDVERETAPAHLADLCPVAPVHVSLHELRSLPATELISSLRSAPLATSDAETMDDLRRLVRLADETGAVLMGSAALARAHADLRVHESRIEPRCASGVAKGRPAHPATKTASTGDQASVLMVLGTAARRVEGQVAHLLAHTSATVHEIPAAEMQRWSDNAHALAAAADRARNGLAHGDLVIRLTDTGEPVDSRLLPALLADLVDSTLTGAGPVHLVVTGGETARAVLDRLRIRALDTLEEIHPGAVMSAVAGTDIGKKHADAGDDGTPDVRRIVTRPGGQGDETSLTLIHRTLRQAAPTLPTATACTTKETA